MRTELTAAEAGQLAHELGPGSAFLRAEQGIYVARDARSPVLALLRGIHAREPQRARWIVRATAWSTLPPTATCAGAVRIAGKKLVAPVEALNHGLRVPGERIVVAPAPPRRAAPELEPDLQRLVDAGGDPVALVRALAQRIAAHDAERVDRPIAALLLSADGRVLEWATNGGSTDATGHAEVNLVALAEARQVLAPDARVVTSLEPCRMCAGVLWDRAPDRTRLQVVFAERDPGRAARDTVLTPGTMARRRFARAGEEHLQPLRRAGIQTA